MPAQLCCQSGYFLLVALLSCCREYRAYWFFVNLQLVIDRAIIGSHQGAGALPANLSAKIKPFPWPAKAEDLGAASAAAFFNLLLVYAFMSPTRAVVGSIVREKELRLREGMRILGLTVRRTAAIGAIAAALLLLHVQIW